MSVLEYALEYAGRGWPVFPLRPRSKQPATSNGFKDATTDPEQIRQWFTDTDYNIACAVPDGYWIFDCDPRNGGLETWDAVAPQLPATTLRFATGGGGTHLWFKGEAPNVRLPGVDIKKGGRGYVVMPPSIHPETGHQYRVDLQAPVAPFSGPIRFQGSQGTGESLWDVLGGDSYAREAAEGSDPILRGDQHETLKAVAGHALAVYPPDEARAVFDRALARCEDYPAHEAERLWDWTYAQQEAGDGLVEPRVLGEDFWSKRPALQHIAEISRKHGLEPDSVFAAVLARIAAMTAPVILQSTQPTSMNTYAALYGPAGTGKSSSMSLAARLIPEPGPYGSKTTGGADGFRSVQVGTGEGLIEAYLDEVTEEITGEDGKPKKVRKKEQTHQGVLVSIDEIDTLTQVSDGRSGTTIMSIVRSAWTGEALGQANAKKENQRSLRAGSYSLGIVVGAQPARSASLLAGKDAGTPQRFLWAEIRRTPEPPTIDEFRSLPRDVALEIDLPTSGVIDYPDAVLEEVLRMQHYGASGATEEERELRRHEPLHLIKLGALLAVLDGRSTVLSEDWQLAKEVFEASFRTMMTAVDYGKRQAAVAEQIAVQKQAAANRALRTDAYSTLMENALPKAVRLISRHEEASKHDGERAPGCKNRCIDRMLSKRERTEFSAVELVDAAIARGLIVGRDGGLFTLRS